jgi:hypothetical protein
MPPKVTYGDIKSPSGSLEIANGLEKLLSHSLRNQAKLDLSLGVRVGPP